MIRLEVPGLGQIAVEHVVCDYNGTLACDGELLSGVSDLLEKLSEIVDIHVLTADTFGTAREQLRGLACKVTVLPREHQDVGKLRYLEKLGPEHTVCIGNGRNDRLMLKEAVIGIGLIQGEGASTLTLQTADIVCRSIGDALSLLTHPKRLVATLRS